jgi:hypothetical protein
MGRDTWSGLYSRNIGGDELKSGLSGQDTVGAVQITIATRSETLF